MSDEERAEIRARLMAARSFHPGPWRVIGGTLVDGEGLPVDFDIPAMREFFRHLLADLQTLTADARRRSQTQDLKPSSPGLRMPSSPPSSDEHVVVSESVFPRKPTR
ncbi:MAG: hypothetical protein R3B40_10855 [Polyangiales bacterium]